LSVLDMNIVTELWLGYELGEYSATRGFSKAVLDNALHSLNERGITNGSQLTQYGHELRSRIEHDTDRTQDAIIATLRTNIEDVISLANVISQRIIDYPGFPSDPRKRAAG